MNINDFRPNTNEELAELISRVQSELKAQTGIENPNISKIKEPASAKAREDAADAVLHNYVMHRIGYERSQLPREERRNFSRGSAARRIYAELGHDLPKYHSYGNEF